MVKGPLTEPKKPGFDLDSFLDAYLARRHNPLTESGAVTNQIAVPESSPPTAADILATADALWPFHRKVFECLQAMEKFGPRFRLRFYPF